ncbi:MAG: S8 family serine peptidase [Bacilli bacterium]|nr:S8 family serine peptidase [Bacilli bacterium]
MRNNFNFKLLIISLLIICNLFFLFSNITSSQLIKAIDYDPVSIFIENKDKVDYQKGNLIIKFKDINIDYEKLSKELNIEIEKINEDFDKVIFKESEYETEEILEILNKHKGVDYAEPNYAYEMAAIPQNEPYYIDQWGLSNSSYGINVGAVWDKTHGLNTTVVAIIDSGIDYNHPDLINQVWVNEDEIIGNGIDDDENGYIDDYYGWSFDDNINNPIDTHGHGTHIAGIIAAEANGYGGVGVAPDVQIMALKVIAEDGKFYSDSIMEAIDYAIAKGVKIFNFSFGSPTYNQSFYDKLNSSNALFICAAGNDGNNNDISSFYPSGYDLDNIIAVASIDKTGSISTFSNYGKNTVDIAAPGGSILSTHLNNKYAYVNGTSMATPFVVGVTALVYGANPYLDILELKGYLLDNTKALPFLEGKVATNGLIDASSAYNQLTDYVAFEGGNGTDEDPYLISTPIQLNAIRNHLSASYRMLNDIDLYADTSLETGLFYDGGLGWEPIGDINAPFTGKLDGSDYTIKGLIMERESSSNVGVFGYIENATIHNLKIGMSSFRGMNNVGGLVGYLKNSNISKVGIFDTAIYGSGTYLGGIVGLNEYGVINITYNNAIVVASGENSIAGGIVGFSKHGIINNSFNLGIIMGNIVGGIVGETFGGNISLVYNLNNNLVGIIGGNVHDAVNIGTTDTVISDSGIAYKNGENVSYTYTIDIKTATSMMKAESYPNFDFTNIWKVNIEDFISLKDIIYREVMGVSITSGNIELEGYGTTKRLMLNFNPNNASNKNVSWESLDNNVVEVDQYGLITVVGKGETEIIVKTLNGKYQDAIAVTVNKVLFDISVEKSNMVIQKNYDQQIKVIFNPIDVPNQNVTYVSSNTDVATVDGEGKVYGVGLGTATITITSEDEGYQTIVNVTICEGADLNNDGKVSVTDLIKLRRYLAGLETFDDMQKGAADINHDGKVTLTDLVRLRRYLAGMGEL